MPQHPKRLLTALVTCSLLANPAIALAHPVLVQAQSATSSPVVVNDAVCPPEVACLDERGQRQVGWVSYGPNTFYCQDGGIAVKGWQFIDGAWYWFDLYNAVMAKGLSWVDGAWHDFNDDGVWLEKANEPSGTWETTDAGKKYRLKDGGYLSDCLCELGGEVYAFHDDGILSTNEYIVQKVATADGFSTAGNYGVPEQRERTRRYAFLEMWPNNDGTPAKVSGVTDHAYGSSVPSMAALYVSDMKGHLVKGTRELPFGFFSGQNEAELPHAPAIRAWYYFGDDYAALRHAWHDGHYYMGDGWMLTTMDPQLSGAPELHPADGLYTIRSKVGACVLDVVGAGGQPTANAQIWAPRDNPSQLFYLQADSKLGTWVSLAASGGLLMADSGIGGANVRQTLEARSSAHTWIVEDAGDGYVYLRTPYGFYLDVCAMQNKNGTNVQTWQFNGADAQKWKLVKTSGAALARIPEGDYVLRSKVGGRVLDIVDASLEVGANAQVWEPLGNAAQTFHIGWKSELFANNIRLSQAGHENLWLDAAGGDGQVNVWQYTGNASYAQNWFFEDAGDGYFYVRNLFGYYLDVYCSVNANGTNVQAWEFNGANAQRWKPVRVSGAERRRVRDGSYEIRSEADGRSLCVNGEAVEGANVGLAPDDAQVQEFTLAWDDATHANTVRPDGVDLGVRLDAAGGDGETNAWLYRENRGFAQGWFFEPAGNGSYYVRDVYGYYLTAVGESDDVRVTAYDGSAQQRWWVARDYAKGPVESLGEARIEVVGTTAWTGAEVRPAVRVTFDDDVLVEGRDYTLSYVNNVRPGMASVAVTGMGSFAGSASTTFEIPIPSRDPDGGWPPEADHWVDWGDGSAAGARWYVYRNGELRRSCWVEYGGAWYYLGPDGAMWVGRQWLNYRSTSGWFFFNPEHDGTFGRMRTGWYLFEGDWYYMEPQAGSGRQGVCVTGWREIDGARYRFDDDGRLAETA